MNRYIACLGFISYLVLGALAKVTVSVGNDIVVKPTPYPLIDPKDKVDVVLNCNGSRSDLSYYIKNRIEWTFIGDDGTSKKYSVGFYLTEGMNKTKFNVLYGEDAPGAGKYGYLTSLSISGVDRADNGVYRCSLLNESNVIEDSKEVKLTVVNPVEKVTLEIHDSNHKVIRQSSSPLTKKSEVLTMVPGEYMVKCMASGSNPEPVMSLFLNEKKPYVVVDVKEDKTIFQSFMGSYKLDLTINAMNTEQNLVCKANIPGNHYHSVEAGIPLMVKIDKPTIVCANATAAVDDRNSKIMCMVTAEGNNDALVCDNVSWLLGTKGQTIAYDARWKDPAKEYDIIESTCVKSNEGLTVELDLFLVSPVLFKETFFLVYGKGGNAHRHPVMLYDITTAAAGMATPLSLLACLVMAVLSKHLARL